MESVKRSLWIISSVIKLPQIHYMSNYCYYLGDVTQLYLLDIAKFSISKLILTGELLQLSENVNSMRK